MESTPGYNRLRQLRNEKRLSGIFVANELGVTPQYYYDLEVGRRRLNEDMLKKLANLYDASIDYILGRTDERNYFVAKESQDYYETMARKIKKLPDAERRIIEIIISSAQDQSASLEK